jgi:radical SAM protein with 4Fe4S-binding SPASM domain
VTYQEENNELMYDFFNRMYFNHKFTKMNRDRVEIYYNPICNLKCKYCYINKYGDKLYPNSNNEVISKNFRIFIDWLEKNDYKPKIEMFSGEPLIQDRFHDDMNYLLDRIEFGDLHVTNITIPTNATFILYDEYTKKTEELLKRSKRIGLHLHISISIDGKYCESNRPMKSGKEPRDDEYYDKLFKFASKYKFGFHPMIYSKEIDKWIDNFKWFQDMFKKHDIPWHNLYLLEVRNKEWTSKEINEYGKFLEFLIRWFWKKSGEDINRYLKTVRATKGFNILSTCFSTIGRGIGCSIQSDFSVRMNDLAIVPCHRTSYDFLNYGCLKVKDNKIIGIESNNINLLVSIYSTNTQNFPYCETCPIKHMCNGGCLGSQLETTGDLFTPIPTVCELMFKKCMVFYKTLKDLGIWCYYKSHSSEVIVRDMNNIEEIAHGRIQ